MASAPCRSIAVTSCARRSHLARHRGSGRRGGASPRRAASDRYSAARGSGGSSPSPWWRWHRPACPCATSHLLLRQIRDGRRRRTALRAHGHRRRARQAPAPRRQSAVRGARLIAAAPAACGSSHRPSAPFCCGAGGRAGRVASAELAARSYMVAERKARLDLVGRQPVLLLLELLHGDLREVVALLLLRPPPGASAGHRGAA